MIVLDDQRGAAYERRSRLYVNPLRVRCARSRHEGLGLLDEIERTSREGLYWVVALSYDFGRDLMFGRDKAGSHSTSTSSVPASDAPYFIAQAFEGYEPLANEEVVNRLVVHASGAASGLCRDDSASFKDWFLGTVDQVKYEIERGTFYQLNLTFPLSGHWYGCPVELYLRLRAIQPTRFGALWLDEHLQLLSFSPEWFLQHERGRLAAQPMKGTSNAADPLAALVNDPKNRAENIMIVDLLRNDLGRISLGGSVQAGELLYIEKVGELFQMVSNISSEVRSGVSLPEVVEATFPCGSVTGAPKRMAMEWIDRLEQAPRGMYCGALGWLDPPSAGCGLPSFSMSVLIRTLLLHPDNRWSMGVGSGITIDSVAIEEWAECQAKFGFLNKLPCGVGVFETMRLRDGVFRSRALHLQRLLGSTLTLGIPLGSCKRPQEAIDTALSEVVRLHPKGLFRVRLEVSQDGRVATSVASLEASPLKKEIYWAADLLGEEHARMRSTDPLLRHKTTVRDAYDAGWRAAEALGGFDAIFTNERDEVTEGGRSSIFVKVDGEWLTPAVQCGVLPGVMRARILGVPWFKARETNLTKRDCLSAQRVFVCNALRGILEVQFKKPPYRESLPRTSSSPTKEP